MKPQSNKWKRHCKITDNVTTVTSEEVEKAVDGYINNYNKIIRKAQKETTLETPNAFYVKL